MEINSALQQQIAGSLHVGPSIRCCFHFLKCVNVRHLSSDSMCAEGVTNCWSQKSNGDQEGCWFEWWISKGPVTSSAEFSWPWTITGSSSRRTFASKQSSGMFLGLMSLLLANVQLSFVHYSLGFQTLGSWAHKRASFELSWRKVYQRWWGEKLKSKGWCIFLQRWILVHLFLGLAFLV